MGSELATLLIVGIAAFGAGILVGVLIARTRGGRDSIPALVQQVDNVRSELQQLSQLFLVPRTRGVVGETILAELLGAWLPKKSFELQYGFRNGTRVDAAVRLGNRIVPVDSKFPMEAIQRYLESEAAGSDKASDRLPADVRKSFAKHVSDISERYIRPDEGTMGFALMYIPSEGVYYRLFVEQPGELLATALQQNVVPVSPGTLFLYLQTVAYGLRGLSLPQETERLIGELARLNEDLAAFMKSYQVAGTHLRNLTHAFEDAGSKLTRLEVSSRKLIDRDEP